MRTFTTLLAVLATLTVGGCTEDVPTDDGVTLVTRINDNDSSCTGAACTEEDNSTPEAAARGVYVIDCGDNLWAAICMECGVGGDTDCCAQVEAQGFTCVPFCLHWTGCDDKGNGCACKHG